MTDERDTAADRIDSAPVRMRILGEDRELTIPVPLGRRTMLEMLPAARQLTEQAVGVAIDQHARQGRSVSCAAGCSACCRRLVAVSPADHVRDLLAASRRAQRSCRHDHRFIQNQYDRRLRVPPVSRRSGQLR
jgi:hypothetical protein